MRLKLVLKIVEGTVLPCNYMYELSSCLYKVLNEGNPVFTVNDITGNLTESASLYNLGNHSRIWFSSSSILATCTRHSSFAVSNPPAFAL